MNIPLNPFYLCIIILILILIIAAIVLIDISDKNIVVQPYLSDIYSNSESIHNDMINPHYKVKHVNNIIVVDDFLKKDFFMQLREQFDNKHYESKDAIMRMKENSIVIFKGSDIFHKATAIDDGERRILLSMVFCDICQEKQKNLVGIIYEKVKNSTLYQ